MIENIRYYPLIERDFDSHEYIPVFSTMDEAIVSMKHSVYLEEFVNGYYRLCAGRATELPRGKMTIACPACGTRLENITAGEHKPGQALYVCPSCNK